MSDEQISAAEEHAYTDLQEDVSGELRTFELAYVLTRSGIATLRARNAREAENKLEEGDIEGFDEDAFEWNPHVTEIRDVSE